MSLLCTDELNTNLWYPSSTYIHTYIHPAVCICGIDTIFLVASQFTVVPSLCVYSERASVAIQ